MEQSTRRFRRGRIAALAVALLSSALLAVTAVGPAAFAESPGDAVVGEARAVAPDVFVDAAASGPGKVEIQTDGVPLSITVPAEARTGLAVNDVTIGLPFADRAARGARSTNDLTSFDNGNGSHTVPVVHRNGAAQLLTVVEGRRAPTVYEYQIDVPVGARLVADGPGAKVVDADGTTRGVFSAPWAKDAAGRAVATKYLVRGKTLVQVVDHNVAGVQYPVVADPTYTVYTFYYSRANVEEMWRALNNINSVCWILPLSYWASKGCGASPGLADAITQAHYQQKRIKAVYYSCGFNYCSYYRYYVVV